MTFSEDFEIYWQANGIPCEVKIMELAFKEVAYKAWNARVCKLPHAPYTPNDCNGFVLRDGKLVPDDGSSVEIPAWMREAIAFLFDGCKINAIKTLRNASIGFLSLKDSLLIVTHLEKNFKLGIYDPAEKSFLAEKPLDTLTPLQLKVYQELVTVIETEYSELLDK